MTQIPTTIPRRVRKIISAVLWAKLQGLEQGRCGHSTTRGKEQQLKQQSGNTAFTSENAFQAAGSQFEGLKLPSLPMCAGLQHWLSSLFFSPLFPQDVGQGLLPKRWGQPCSSLFPRPRTGWVWSWGTRLIYSPELPSGLAGEPTG